MQITAVDKVLRIDVSICFRFFLHFFNKHFSVSEMMYSLEQTFLHVQLTFDLVL